MQQRKITIASCGCGLLDLVYADASLASEAMRPLASSQPGDGGLVPGQLVFAEELASYAGLTESELAERLTGKQPADAETVGGPAVVALITAAQLGAQVAFYGARGDDPMGQRLLGMLAQHPIDLDGYRVTSGSTPHTTVLSDPTGNDGQGERTFVNTVGAAGNYSPDMLPASFFAADVRLFGATALTPQLHDSLDDLLLRTPSQGLNVVSTVYDFRNEKRAPNEPWPLVSKRARHRVDLLVCDAEEARRLSGSASTQGACAALVRQGYQAVVVTHGAQTIVAQTSANSIFGRKLELAIPVCQKVDVDLQREAAGDTTGCGDNFAGGILFSLAQQLAATATQATVLSQPSFRPVAQSTYRQDQQLQVAATQATVLSRPLFGPVAGETYRQDRHSTGPVEPTGVRLDLEEAIAWGVASGGATCFHLGGVAEGIAASDKVQRIQRYHAACTAEAVA